MKIVKKLAQVLCLFTLVLQVSFTNLISAVAILPADNGVTAILSALNSKFHSDLFVLQSLQNACRENGKPKSFAACKQALQQRAVPATISNPLKMANVWVFIGGDNLSP